MSQHIFKQVWTAISHLNPKDVRELAGRSVLIGLYARSVESYEEMEEFFIPPTLTRERRLEAFRCLYRSEEKDAPPRFDIEIFEEGLPRPHGGFLFRRHQPERMIAGILDANENFLVPLARLFPPFYQPVIDRVIHQVAKENALFSMATALPGIVPVLQLPLAVGEFASDTAVLTVNQVRMAFLLAAASDRSIGYAEQRGEIGSILAGAFGWRAIARELVGKIPFGGGLIPKAAVAYAGTYVAGRVLERMYREGYSMSRQERKDAYEGAFETGKRVAKQLLEAFQAKKTEGK
ncbi:MAG: hypothetical protein JNK48_07270 [Bryobacterales bacterium]|nr:hypothetical protein [Bryobacterales bacterium]